MNIFEMYYKNGKRVGFFVRRSSWRKTLVARIVSIAGFTEGSIRGCGSYPFFNEECKESTFAEMYEITYVGLMRVSPPDFALVDSHSMLARISCPNTYKTYSKVDLFGFYGSALSFI